MSSTRQNTLKDMRTEVQGLGRTVLDVTWATYTTSNGTKWPSKTEFAIRYGLAEVDSAITTLPLGAAYVEQELVQLTLLGALLSTEGEALENNLVAFLLWLQKCAPKDAANRLFKGDDMPGAAGMSGDEFRDLGYGVRFLEIHDGDGPGSGRWHFRASAEIAKIVHSKDVREYLHARAFSIAHRIAALRGFVSHHEEAQDAGTARLEQTGHDPNLAWGPIRAVLSGQGFTRIKEIAGLAGIPPTRLTRHKSDVSASKDALLDDIDEILGELQPDHLQRFLTIVAEEVTKGPSTTSSQLDEYLRRLGWSFTEGQLLRMEVLDPQDLSDVPPIAREDLLKAATRYRDGDLSGALSSACGAVDIVTTQIYSEEKLGNPGESSFQEKITRSLQVRGALVRLNEELLALGWDEAVIKVFRKNLEGSTNQAAHVMQTLRSRMADVHGTKPFLRPLVFDSLKWAALILRLLHSIPDS